MGRNSSCYRCFWPSVASLRRIGALHNQVSYTVRPDYFYAFKFHHLPFRPLQNRSGASIVGWHASWWMGLITVFRSCWSGW